MDMLADLLAMPTTTEPTEVARKFDADEESRRRHIALANDRILEGVSIAEIQRRYGLKSRQSVYAHVRYALSYETVQSAILRHAVEARRSA